MGSSGSTEPMRDRGNLTVDKETGSKLSLRVLVHTNLGRRDACLGSDWRGSN